MLDIERIRKEPEWLDTMLEKRGKATISSNLKFYDDRRREAMTALQSYQKRRNELSQQIGEKKKSGLDASELMSEVADCKIKMEELEQQIAEVEKYYYIEINSLPNAPADDVPVGKDEKENKEVSKVGEPTKFQFNDIKDHVTLGEANKQIDFETAAKLSGARFVVLKDKIARMERALAQLMLDTHTEEFGYTEVSPPLMVLDNAMYGTGQLPKFEEDLFKTTTGHWLIPTAEVSLTNFVNDTIIDPKELPMRFTAFTPCFRSEAGSAGRDTRGMIRQHQFYKVELVSITTPEQSNEEHERMTKAAETVLQKLKLPYRKILLCTGDMGFAAQKTYDLEVWIPSQNTYREISSCSNCGDFQARRMKARYKPEGSKETKFVHTLNGSGMAVGRALVAVMENYQQADGSIKVPDVLVPYMNGVTVIK
jgi:seryl-tRNA synthetase